VLDWVEENRNPAYLFQGARLVQMEGLMKSHIGDLTEDEVEFVKTSVAQRGQKERKELQTALDRAHENDKELTVSRKLSVTKSSALKRTRIILTLLLMCLMTVSYLFYQTANNEKETRRLLAVNYRDNALQARKKKERLYGYHLMAEAVTVNPDPTFGKRLLSEINQFRCHLPLHILQHEGPTGSAKLNTASPLQKWDFDGVDYDFPIDKIKLRVMVLTGTKLNALSREVGTIEPQHWHELKKQYLKFAREHYKTCKYPQANVYRKLFLGK
ncbi:MAG: hypothetical protein GY757_15385, partial [bacterium]|nr:hypothetical protein [bacterium]